MTDQQEPPGKPPADGKPKRRKKKPKPAVRLSKEKASQLLAEIAFPAPGETRATICERYNITDRTLRRIEHRAESVPELSALVENKRQALSTGWKDSRIRFLRHAIDKLEKLVAEAGVAQMRDVAGAIKIVGDLQNVSSALGDPGEQQLGSAGAGQAPPETSGGGGGAPAASDESGPSVH